MRRVLTARLALATALLLLSGCGGGGTSTTTGNHASSGPQVTLNLKGGRGERLSACGSAHHYTAYPRGAPIEFAGAVSPVPNGRWKIKLKLKACRSSGFVEVQKVEATRDKHTGHFRGTLPALPRGAYFGRASLYENGQQITRSDKRHFEIR